MSHEDEVRPFHGELPDIDGERMPWVPDRENHATWAERREAKLADGLCPLPGCGGRVDESWFCSQCGQVSLPVVPEPANVFLGELPTPRPRELVDCFAPANIDDEAA